MLDPPETRTIQNPFRQTRNLTFGLLAFSPPISQVGGCPNVDGTSVRRATAIITAPGPVVIQSLRAS